MNKKILFVSLMLLDSAKQSSDYTHKHDFMDYDLNYDEYLDASELRQRLPALSPRDLYLFLFLPTEIRMDS